MEVKYILVLISLIILLGYLAVWIFKKKNIPDTLFLIFIGFIIGPDMLNIINPDSLNTIAPLFTTFTLLFLIFDGSLNIDLKSFALGIGSGITIGGCNFILSSIIITGIFYFLTDDLITCLIVGFSLGGVSSAYIIPTLKQIKVEKTIFSVLILESALTDVLSIVFAITMMELKILNVINIENVFSKIASLFFVAGVLGILAGFLWIVLEDKILKEDSNYVMTIAYMVLLYFITEYLGGNGAIAAMCFGIIITNSKTLYSMAHKFNKKRKSSKEEEKNDEGETITTIVTKREKMFYQEISFFLKTFFFVYIGLLLNVRNQKAVCIGTAVAVAILLLRTLTSLFTKKYKENDRLLINSLFARGIAPAAIVTMAIEKNLIMDQTIIDTVYFIITATIILSSIRVFLYKSKVEKEKANNCGN